MSAQEKKIFGLLGYPISHSLSPLLHNAALRSLKINAEYRLFEVAPQDFDKFLSNISEDVCGLNVTVPYKERILDFVTLDIDSLYLKEIGAINTIVKQEKVWCGFNTDIPGFSTDLVSGFDPLGKRAAILGSGGAARAVAYALANSGAKEIVLYDIDPVKSAAVAGMVRSMFPGYHISAVDGIEKLNLKEKDLLVNATPIGLKDADPLLIDPDSLHKGLFVYDLIYNPARTKLLKAAEEKGLRVSNGLGMLLYQGAISFEHFTGCKAPVEVMREALKKGADK